MDPDKVDAIVRWPHSTNLEELQIFLGFADFYYKFIQDCAKIAVPMTNQLKDKGHSLLLSMLLRSGVITYMVPPLRYYLIMRVSNGLQVNVT